MKSNVFELLACPVCHSDLHSETIHKGNEITSGRIVCGGCRRRYPIVLARPILLPPGARSTWVPAMAEVLSERPGALNRSFFFSRLPKQFEVQLANLHRPWEQLRSGPRRWRITKELLSVARSRKSGWFKDRDGFPHYDMVPSRRRRALRAGAQEMSLREWIRAGRDGGETGG